MPVTPGLYENLLGPAFARLPPTVAALHGAEPHFHARGRVQVVRGTGRLSRLVGRLMGFPPAADDLALRFHIHRQGGAEHWVREFGAHRLESRQWRDGAELGERMGLARLRHALVLEQGVLSLRTSAFRVLGLPLPRALWPRVRTAERERDGRYHFSVEAHVIGLGLVVAYRGWLAPERAA